MAPKFDKQKTKHQLFHLSISLATVIVCMMHMHNRYRWEHIGSFWNSMVVPIVFTGEILKIILVHYFDRLDESAVLQRQRKRKVANLSTKEIFNSLFLQILCTTIFAFVCIILGAPVLHRYEQTFVLALLLTIYVVSPTVFLLGGSGALQVCFCENNEFITKSESTALDLFKYNAVGALIGAWVGSVVAPLDWDREWQNYPIPNIIGALLGSAFGNIVACCRVLYNTAGVLLSKKFA